MLSQHTQMARGPRRYTLIAAILGWSALALQLYLVLFARWVDQASLSAGVVRFFSFFTVTTNTLVATVLTCAITSRGSCAHRFFRTPWVSSGVAANIVLVSIAYNLLLRPLWQPHGLQRVADELLHDILPVLFLFYWWVYVPKGTLRIKHVLLWVIYPLAYFAYALLRGYLISDYMYPFIDVSSLGYPQTFFNALGVLVGFLLISGVLLAVDRLKGRMQTHR
ncbi:Pr6Pr family membrane protein [Pseudomonas sp. 10B1]|uniref:Pr6Pr family membrane protein n=1 Tax=unclassified Pseudomonas TaxID=196821 RepID=UPI002AB4B1B1|nr:MULTISPECIES: Pr6Pr family membrane protein [unclassified Pseudomonas]MDY7561659.1 Pr6Pr family membrane protein [Pseudomonas sp. AB6]MEA9978191.1 Pr6Pr family membrane protein [Pseudomonas sp. RTS4]MEA9994624.1 Pr6Pr family membrane protein [Pseudomonas sp. AA4]MEB0085769.1 Pr6Pr family membrane protein [Pseudomonas sp. RTI1]MEB0125906.1 Pr6Pr family membrane protein [Pseudomonas sp. CCC1.2]